jgi:SAM-dependent methyltransferase
LSCLHSFLSYLLLFSRKRFHFSSIKKTGTDNFGRAISLSPDYPTVLQRLNSGKESFLDLGCCFGQELRKVAADGAPSENLYGADLRPEFFELGYRHFLDRDTLKSKFIAADIFDPSSALSTLDGKIDIIYAGSFLHLFGYADQVTICKRIVKLLRDKKGSLLWGDRSGILNLVSMFIE